MEIPRIGYLGLVKNNLFYDGITGYIILETTSKKGNDYFVLESEFLKYLANPIKGEPVKWINKNGYLCYKDGKRYPHLRTRIKESLTDDKASRLASCHKNVLIYSTIKITSRFSGIIANDGY